jgi:hypothetical protein
MTTDLLVLARQLVEKAQEQGILLRMLGSLAVREHGKGAGALPDLLERVPTRDIDFMGYSSQQAQTDRFFKGLGYEIDPAVAHSQEYGIQRLIYHHHEEQVMAEVFLDVLRMSHTLDLRGRLELDSPTISLIDLLLSKLQIQQITEKDIKDMIALLAEHDLGSGDRERIDPDHLLKLIRDNWGLWYTALGNLRIVREWVDRVPTLPTALRADAETRIDSLIQRVENEPKTLRWKARARLGTRARWYEEVHDVHDRNR